MRPSHDAAQTCSVRTLQPLQSPYSLSSLIQRPRCGTVVEVLVFIPHARQLAYCMYLHSCVRDSFTFLHRPKEGRI